MRINICPRCGKKLSENARYCSECGYFMKRKNYNTENNIEIDEELYRIDDINLEADKEDETKIKNNLEQEKCKDILKEENKKEKEYEISNRENIKKIKNLLLMIKRIL